MFGNGGLVIFLKKSDKSLGTERLWRLHIVVRGSIFRPRHFFERERSLEECRQRFDLLRRTGQCKLNYAEAIGPDGSKEFLS